MTTQFDASLIPTAPLGEDVQGAHMREVEQLASMPSKLANAKLHAQNELDRWVLSCNRLVWGAMANDGRAPTAEEVDRLFAHLTAENAERLRKEAQLAAEARNLVALIGQAEAEAKAAEAQAAEEAARLAAEQALREEFEAIDAAGKEARFRAWLESR